MATRMREIARSLAVLVLSTPIHVYRYCLSPFLPPSCRFEPSCSAYALQALAAHGPLRGSLLTVRRLLRCHPVRWLGSGSGFDPVPPR